VRSPIAIAGENESSKIVVGVSKLWPRLVVVQHVHMLHVEVVGRSYQPIAMKHQCKIHLASAVLLPIATLVAWHWLPPYLVHNPGVQALIAIVIVAEVGHFVFHGR
jgi:hypothetical protein